MVTMIDDSLIISNKIQRYVHRIVKQTHSKTEFKAVQCNKCNRFTVDIPDQPCYYNGCKGGILLEKKSMCLLCGNVVFTTNSLHKLHEHPDYNREIVFTSA